MQRMTKAFLLAVMLALLAGLVPAIAAEPQPDPALDPALDPIATAYRLLDRLESGEYEAATADFSVQMKAALGPDKLQAVQQQIAAAGAVESRDAATVTQQSGMNVVVIRIHRADASVDATVAIDGEGKVAGLHFAPAPPPPAAAPAANADYREQEVQVGDDERALPGTLAMPKTASAQARVPAVLLVHGSGPHDRDETIGPNRPFLDIARGLAAHGIAVLRYDKRTKARPQDFAGGDGTIGNFSIDDETTDDAVAAVALLRNTDGIDPDRVYVLGHSLGGMLAPRIAQRSADVRRSAERGRGALASDGVAGLILLAAPSRPLLDILIEQNQRMAAMDGEVSAAEHEAIETLLNKIERLRAGDDLASADAPLGLPARYWRSVEAIDPVADARALSTPMLVVHGGRDIQVVEADRQGWRDAFAETPRVTLKAYPALDHLGIAGEGPGSLADYQRPGRVDQTLIDDIARWIGQH